MLTATRPRILRRPDVLDMVGASAPTIWRWEKAGTFPRRIRLGGNSVGYLESEILEWLQHRLDEREVG